MVLILGDSLKIRSFSAFGCATLALCSFEVPSSYLHRCVLCLLYVPSIPTYLPVLQKYFTFRASPHHRRAAHDSEPIRANLRRGGFVPIGSESCAVRLCLLYRHALTIYSDNRQDGQVDRNTQNVLNKQNTYMWP